MKILILIIILAGIAIFFSLDLGQYVTLDYIKSEQDNFTRYYAENKILTIMIFAGIYISMAGLSLPGATILTLLSGALFGLFNGLIIVSFASTIGATLAFLVSRYLMQDYIQNKYSDKLISLNEGMEREGAYYLFAMRLVPIFPFFIVNILMGLTNIKILTFFITSQIGMLAGTTVFVYVGTQLATINSISGILKPELIIGFILLGIFPIITKKLLKKIRKEAKNEQI